MLAIPLSLFVIPLALLRGKKWARWAWLIIILGIFLLGAVLISWDGNAPAYFYGRNIQTNPERKISSTAPLGKAVITQEGQGGTFYHFLNSEDLKESSGKTATLGAWIWADRSTSMRFPGIQEGEVWIPPLSVSAVPTIPRIHIPNSGDLNLATPIEIVFSSRPIELSTEPQFYSFETVIPPMGDNIIWMYFPASSEEDNKVYYDGIVLAEGDFTALGTPELDNEESITGTWGGIQFTNLVSNGSGEKVWPAFSDWAEKLIRIPNRNTPSLSLILSPIIDFNATSIYYQITGERIFRTFWAVFGWANVALFGQKPYRFFLVLTLIYIIGIITALISGTYKRNQMIHLFLSFSIMAQILLVVFRGVGSWFTQVYVPVGRYIYPVIIPMGIIMQIAVKQIINFFHKRLHIRLSLLYGSYIFLQLGIMAWSMISLWTFYDI